MRSAFLKPVWILASALWVISGHLEAAQLARGPYLQQLMPSGVIIRWRTDSATDSVVRYGTSVSDLPFRATNADLVTEHAIRLTGLAP
jgi:hypothetical protein